MVLVSFLAHTLLLILVVTLLLVLRGGRQSWVLLALGVVCLVAGAS